jgi:hypothetical protein
MSRSRQKTKPEDPGGLEQRRERQRRRSEGKTIAAFAVTAGIGLAAVASSIVGALGGQNTTTPADRTPTVAPGTFSEAQPGVAVTTTIPAGTFDRYAREGRYSLTVEGVPFSFSVPTPGWERFGSISLNKSTVGPQGAEAMIYWMGFPEGIHADPCRHLRSASVGPSAAELAAVVSTAPGTTLVTGPSDVTVGGRAAKHVVITVREDVGCDPGFFYTWQDAEEGALWPITDVGDTIRVWIVDVDGTRLFIAGETKMAAGSELEQEIRQIIESIRFD